MSRIPRSASDNTIYHILNRANSRERIFHKAKDYEAFENMLLEGKEKYPMRILAYCLMPNHWHFVLYPKQGADLSVFMRWLTGTHTQRWHTHYKSIGYGHLYQGRYKSFPVQKDEHFLQLVRYVERNALRANLVKKAEDWRWSSIWRREHGTEEQKKILSSWPIETPKNYKEWLNKPQNEDELEALRLSVNRGRPYGNTSWVDKTAKRLGLLSTLKPRGRPRKGV
jgi:putative transposase